VRTWLLVTADAGGSNGYRVRAWKTELARFAARPALRSPFANSRRGLKVASVAICWGRVSEPAGWDHIPPCGSDDLAVSVRWERSGVGLAGQIIVENVSGRTCRLSHKPWVIPLGTDGRELPAEVIITADLRLPPMILDPGGRAAAPVGWAGWCGDAASGVVRINWISGSADVEVQGPRQPDCPDSGQPTNLSSSWFDTLD
jgi:hypothetical protein